MALVHKVNDAADAVGDAKAFAWVVFHMVQGMEQNEATNAMTACCNQIIRRLGDGSGILEGIAAEERANGTGGLQS